ncbi:GrpB family protein [Flavobacterium ginsenosidimutans]|uniref:GrpB family protein n=1 Tax=Flavobacterium ginsenosidimutans TaxID=687844 RepID=A0ABZ2Q2M8_9FLAO
MISYIEPYDPKWKAEFEQIKKVLEDELKDLEICIEHIGSTAVPGLFAKPILDIDIIIGREGVLGLITSRLEKLGYQTKGEQGIEGRFAFGQVSDHVPFTNPIQKSVAHHLYVCYSDSLALKNHLLFRDALIKDANLVVEYSALKKLLVEDLNISREEYQRKKTDFIISVLKGAGLMNTELDQIKGANT